MKIRKDIGMIIIVSAFRSCYSLNEYRLYSPSWDKDHDGNTVTASDKTIKKADQRHSPNATKEEANSNRGLDRLLHIVNPLT